MSSHLEGTGDGDRGVGGADPCYLPLAAARAWDGASSPAERQTRQAVKALYVCSHSIPVSTAQ